MKIRAYRTYFIQTLAFINDTDEAESFFYLILEAKNKLKRVDLALQPNLELLPQELIEWDVLLAQLKQEVPIQYLLGITSFYGLEFKVNSNVLIPRPETEELVEWIVQSYATYPNESALTLLDIGTGSGCIAISLAKTITNASVYALDISKKALATAQENAALNKVNVVFLEQNILEIHDLQQQFDCIVSNPPYVRNLEKSEIKNNVLLHEPHEALFVADTDALLFYKKIAELALLNLKPNGLLFFEINQYFGNEMVALLKKMNFKNITLRKDIYGNHRMIQAGR